MTILVTGGTGFLGSHIIEQLSQAGRPVRALVRRSSDTKFLRTLSNVELLEGARQQRDVLRGLPCKRSPPHFNEDAVDNRGTPADCSGAVSGTLTGLADERHLPEILIPQIVNR